MKICIVSDAYYPYPGGVSEHIHHTAIELRRLGHEAKILTASFGDNKGFEHDDVIRVGRTVLVPINKSMATITIGRNLSGQVKKILTRGGFDIVHTHGPLAPMLPFLALRHSPAVNVATFHASHADSTGYQLFEPILQRYFRRIDGLIAVSETARESMYKYFPGDYRIIPNGVDTDRFHRGMKPVAHLADGRPSILFVGRFDPRKGLKYLLQAIPYVVEKVPDARLVVVGKGVLDSYYRRYLDNRYRDHVIFEGFVTPEELPSYYATCDVFCSPATGSESFGIILLEAMATGKPIVASNISGYRSVVSDGVDGLLVEPRDAQALAQALILLLRDSLLRARLGHKGREKALRYSWNRVTKQIEEYYQEVAERSQSRRRSLEVGR
jgi:phosphatidylinositol alpha-mannosyltransferase